MRDHSSDKLLQNLPGSLDLARQEAFALTVRVVEDDDAALLRLCLLRIHHGSTHDEVGVWVFAKLAGDQAKGVFVL